MWVRRLANWLAWFVEEYQPAWCAVCGYMMFHKNAHHEMMTMGKVVHLCNGCWRELYAPFDKTKGGELEA